MAKNKDKSKVDEPVKEEEQPVTSPPPKKKEQLISSKMFVKTLKKELQGENISEPVYIAFERSVQPAIDSEENFREKWNKSFKRT